MSLRILNLIDIPWHSGVLEYALIQSKALSIANHNVFFGIPKTNKKYNEISQEYKTIEISDRKKILLPTEIFKIYRFVKENKIELINAHTGRMQTLAYIISKINPKIKIIRTKSDAQTIKKTFTYSNVKLVICGSKYIENMYQDISHKPKTKTIYLSYQSQIPFPLPQEKPFKITIVARLDPVKGHKNFIKAALDILEKRNDVLFLIVGKEANLTWKNLSSIIPSKYLNYFRYLGFINNVYEIMKQSHLGIISSISSEAVSRVAVEWMNSQRAIISSDVGCLPELIDKDFIYPRDDWKKLSLKIEENLDIDKLENIGKKNKEKFLTLFSFDRFLNETISVFENI